MTVCWANGDYKCCNDKNCYNYLWKYKTKTINAVAEKITDATACICKLTNKHEHNLKKTELYLSIVTNVILI